MAESEEDEPTDEYDNIEAMIVNMEDKITKDQGYFNTNAGKFDTIEAYSMIPKLCKRSATYALLKNVDEMEDIDTPPKTICGASISPNTRYGAELFHVIMNEIGAAGKSTAENNQ